MKNIEEIPLFPLGIVLLPLERLPLHIFEPRYKIMMLNAINNKTPFGIVFKDSKKLLNIGCEAKVFKVLKTYPNGESDIMVEGINRFEIQETYLEDQTVVGKVKILTDEKIQDEKIINEIHENYLKLLLKIGKSDLKNKDLAKQLSYEFIQNIVLPTDIKKTLIVSKDEKGRIKIINKLFKKILSLPENNSEGLIPEA